MADRIKGITIEIDGNTTGLKQSLSGITKESISIQKELTDVQRLLKFDPGNTAALAQKQELLSKQIEITSQKLQALKNAESQVNEQFSNGKLGEEQYRSFQREIQFTEASLNKFKATAAEVGNNSSQIQKLENNFKGLDQEIKKTAEDEKKLSLAEGLNKLESGVGSAKGKILDLKSTFLGISAAAAGGFGLFKFTEGAIQAGDNAYKLSQKLHLTAAESASLNKIFSVTGTDSQAFAGVMTKLDKSILGAGESGNSTTKMLDRYGVSLTDANNKLLPMNQQLEALAAAYQKSSEAGEEDAFSAEVLGNKGASLIPLLENYTDAKEAAAKVKGIGIDPKEAHETEEQLKVLKMQAAATGGVLAKALLPVVEAVLPPLIAMFQNLATKVKENKAELDKFIQSVVATGKQLASVVGPIVSSIFSTIAEHGEASKNVITGLVVAFAGFEGITKTINGVKSAMDTWNNFSKISSDITSMLAKLGLWTVATEAQTAATEAETVAQEGLNVAQKANIIGLIITAVMALVAAIVYLWNTNEGFRNAIIGAWTTISTTVGSVCTWISTAWNTLWSTLTSIIEPVIQSIEVMWTGFVANITGIWNMLQNTWSVLCNALSPIIEPIITLIAGLWTGFVDNVKGAWDILQGAWNTICSALSPIISPIIEEIGGLWTGFVSNVQGAWEILQTAWNTVCSYLSPVIMPIIEGITSAWNGFQTAFQTVADGIKYAWDTVVGGIKDAWEGIKAPFQAVIDWIANAWESIKSKFKVPHFTFSGSMNPTKWESEGAPSVGVDWYANGGIMTNPTLFGFNGNNAMVGGEAGPEAILPLSVLFKQMNSIISDTLSKMNTGNSYEFNISNANTQSITGDMTREMLDTMKSMKDEISSLKGTLNNMGIYMDSRKVGKLVTPTVNQELGSIHARSLRGLGW